jgi:hypothetical protein
MLGLTVNRGVETDQKGDSTAERSHAPLKVVVVGSDPLGQSINAS